MVLSFLPEDINGFGLSSFSRRALGSSEPRVLLSSPRLSPFGRSRFPFVLSVLVSLLLFCARGLARPLSLSWSHPSLTVLFMVWLRSCFQLLLVPKVTPSLSPTVVFFLLYSTSIFFWTVFSGFLHVPSYLWIFGIQGYTPYVRISSVLTIYVDLLPLRVRLFHLSSFFPPPCALDRLLRPFACFIASAISFLRL